MADFWSKIFLFYFTNQIFLDDSHVRNKFKDTILFIFMVFCGLPWSPMVKMRLNEARSTTVGMTISNQEIWFSKRTMTHMNESVLINSSLLLMKEPDNLSNLVTDPEHVREHTFYQANIFFIITSICSMSTTISFDMNSAP